MKSLSENSGFPLKVSHIVPDCKTNTTEILKLDFDHGKNEYLKFEVFKNGVRIPNEPREILTLPPFTTGVIYFLSNVPKGSFNVVSVRTLDAFEVVQQLVKELD